MFILGRHLHGMIYSQGMGENMKYRFSYFVILDTVLFLLYICVFIYINTGPHCNTYSGSLLSLGSSVGSTAAVSLPQSLTSSLETFSGSLQKPS